MDMTERDVLMEFLKTPIDSTERIFEKFLDIPGTARYGSGLEQILYKKGERENPVLLVAHADTVWDAEYMNGDVTTGDVVEKDGIISNTIGGLGADDRAGCAMIWLLQDIGHSILITNGEEHGRLGSCYLRDKCPDIYEEINSVHQFAIQLDRRNAADYKCYGVGTDQFRNHIEDVTGFTEPDRRASTDIVTLCRNICGVNLSVGYYNEHTSEEYLIYPEWEDTLNLCRDWLSREELPLFELKSESPSGR